MLHQHELSRQCRGDVILLTGVHIHAFVSLPGLPREKSDVADGEPH